MSPSIIDTLIHPDAFFRDAEREKEDLKIPILMVSIVAIIGAAYGYLIGNLTARLMAGVMPGIEGIILISTVLGALVGTFVFWIVWTAIIYGLSMIFKGSGSFKKTLSVIGYGYLPQAIGSLITLIAAFEYLPKVKVPALSTAGVPQDQIAQVIQNATITMMHDPAMVELTQITALITIVFLLWSANIWIFGVRQARSLSARDAALCVGIPVVIYILYLIYTLGAS